MQLEAILSKYPQHKTVIGLKSKYDKQQMLTAAEIAELEKFYKLLVK